MAAATSAGLSLGWKIAIGVIAGLLAVGGVTAGIAVSQSDKYGAYAGKYVNPGDSEDYIILKGDGTFEAHDGYRGFSGKYSIQGNEITIDWHGLLDKGAIQGNTLYDSSGTAYVKEGGAPAQKES